MRIAFVLTPTYRARDDVATHTAAEGDARAVHEALCGHGYDFRIIDVPVVDSVDAWLSRAVAQHAVSPEDTVLVYVSAVAHLDEAGELSLELDHVPVEEGLRRRVSLARLRSAMTAAAVRGAAVVLDLVHQGDPDPVHGAEYVGAARRVFAPELSGYSLLCAARSSHPVHPGPSPFTHVFLQALAEPSARNAVGAATVSRVMDVMRDNPELYETVPSFALVPGRRDIIVFSASSAPIADSSPPPSVRLNRPSSPPSVAVEQLFSQAAQLLEQGHLEATGEALKKALLLIIDSKSPRKAEAYRQLGRVRAREGRRPEAIVNYRKALAIRAADPEALDELAEIVRAEGDFAEAAKLHSQLLELVDGEQRADILMRLADDFEKSRQPQRAAEALESVHQLRPADLAVLAHLAQLHDSMKAYGKVVDVKVAMAKLKRGEDEVSRALVLAADFAMERAKDVERALEILAMALDQDPLTPRAFDTIADVLVERGDLRAYERALVAHTVRLDRVGAHAAEAEMWRHLAIVRRSHLGDLAGAIEALDRCVERVPNDVEARAALSDLLAEAGRLEDALISLEIASYLAPGRAETYRCIYQLCRRLERVDQAMGACAVLTHLEEADIDEQMFCEQYQSDGLVRPSRALDEASWEMMYPPSHDACVRSILRAVAPAAISFRLEVLRKHGMLASLDSAARQDPQTSTVSLTRTLVWASTILDVPLPEIYVAEQVPGGIAVVPAEAPTVLVGRSVLKGRGLQELAFLVGRDLTYYRPEHYILVLYSSLRELTALFLGSVHAARPELALPESSRLEIDGVSKWLRRHLDEERREQLRQAVDRFDAAGGRVDLATWARSIELAATRAGFLLCGDLAGVREVLGSEERAVADLDATERMNDLVPFAASESYVKLRQTLGIATGSSR